MIAKIKVKGSNYRNVDFATAKVMRLLPWISKRYNVPMEKLTVEWKEKPEGKKEQFAYIIISKK